MNWEKWLLSTLPSWRSLISLHWNHELNKNTPQRDDSLVLRCFEVLHCEAGIPHHILAHFPKALTSKPQEVPFLTNTNTNTNTDTSTNTNTKCLGAGQVWCANTNTDTNTSTNTDTYTNTNTDTKIYKNTQSNDSQSSQCRKDGSLEDMYIYEYIYIY